jgi:signal peptidase I
MAKYQSMVVEGDSMSPTYTHGDWLFGRWAHYAATGIFRIKANDVVVIEREDQPGIFYVKRITEIRKSGHKESTIFLLSDNEAGTDSRQWGWLPISTVKAKIYFRVKRKKR